MQQYELKNNSSQKYILNRYENTNYFTFLSYKDKNRMLEISSQVNSIGYKYLQLGNSTGYIYGDNAVSGQKAGLIYGVKLNGTQQLAYQYDELARLKTRTLNTTNPFVTEYGYLEGGVANTTTTLVKTVKNGNDTLEYTYDELGNITSVSKNGTTIEQYTYDALSQLTSATYGGNTYTYTYDNGGNLTEIKKNGTVIKSYTYGNSEWKDLLTAFNGQTITYDDIGNPLTYRNGMSFTWQNGRQLATITQNENAVATYTYDADGLRTSKTVNGTTTEYYWQNGVLYGQKTGSEYIFFLYDENGIAYGFIIQNGTEKSHYYYEFNLQSDIIGIVDSNGTQIVEYTYGAWGDIISITGTHADTIGQKNPLRYRGYYYDAETGFYYLNSRYYDAEVGRFMNADGAVAGIGGNVNGYNLYLYCFNNPINMNDQYGNWPGITNKIIQTVVTIESSLSGTISDFQASGAMIGDGYFGSNPYAIGRVLNKEGIAYSRVGINNMTQPGTYIISFWNENAPWNGLHTVAVSYDGSIYTAYNLQGNGNVHTLLLSDYNNLFICGYYLR